MAGFDMDWTLARNYKGVWPKDPTDIRIMTGRVDKLKKLQNEGWTIVVFTNQKSTGKKIDFNFKRVNNFIKLLGIPIIVAMAIGEDEYRKPNVGMYQLITKMLGPIKTSFYCGDAAGRRGDFSDSDKGFALNCGMRFYHVEDLFPSPTFDIPSERCMILFVGMPGVGKTTYFDKHLLYNGYMHVNQDVLKSKGKCLTITKQACESGRNVCIDCTNPGQSRREEFYSIGSKHGYEIIVIFFEGDGRSRNKLRPKPVPSVGYGMYYKYLVEPTDQNTPGKLYVIG